MFHKTLTAKAAVGVAMTVMMAQAAAADSIGGMLVHPVDCPEQPCPIINLTLSPADIVSRGAALDQSGFGVIQISEAGDAGDDGFKERMKGFWTVGTFR